MVNITVENVDLGSVVLKNGEFQNDTVEITSPQDLPEGLILARDSLSGLLIPFVKGGVTNEDGIPKAILTYTKFVGSFLGTQPFAIRVLISGEVRKQRLIIAADGDDSNVDDAVKDQLRDYSIVPIEVQELSVLDNQDSF